MCSNTELYRDRCMARVCTYATTQGNPVTRLHSVHILLGLFFALIVTLRKCTAQAA